MSRPEPKTLLEKAQRVPVAGGRQFEVDPELLEAAIAWFKGDVAGAQVAVALGMKQNAATNRLVTELKNAVRAGKLKLEVLP